VLKADGHSASEEVRAVIKNTLARKEREKEKEHEITSELHDNLVAKAAPLMNQFRHFAKGVYSEEELAQQKRTKRKRLMNLLKNCLCKLRKLNLTPAELLQDKPFPTKPLERPLSQQFIDAARRGELSKLQSMISLDRYLVYQKDEVTSG
jgi:hypothetical protein